VVSGTLNLNFDNFTYNNPVLIILSNCISGTFSTISSNINNPCLTPLLESTTLGILFYIDNSCTKNNNLYTKIAIPIIALFIVVVGISAVAHIVHKKK